MVSKNWFLFHDFLVVDVDDDRLEDMICDVGAESFAINAWIWKYIKRCRDSIVSWINYLHTVVGGVKNDEFEGNKWMD